MDIAVGVMAAVHLARLIYEIEQGLAQQGQDLVLSPVVTKPASRRRWVTGRLRPVFFAIDRVREGGKLGHDCRDAVAAGLALR